MIIFDIKRGSLHDGPGIRTVVFFKGCPLRCRWCHNPESYIKEAQLAYRAEKCINCGACAAACPNRCHSFSDGIHRLERSKCIACGACESACRYKALEIFGKSVKAEEIIGEVIKDSVYYEASGGGLTLSGGEPLYQAEDAKALAKTAHEAGISVCVETCGFGQKEDFLEIANYVDYFLFDIKVRPELYKIYTNVDSGIIFENLSALDKAGAKTILRCPIIPEVNMNDEHFLFISELAKSLKNICEINLEPYHPIGLAKAESLGISQLYKNPEFTEKKELFGFCGKIEKETGIRVKFI